MNHDASKIGQGFRNLGNTCFVNSVLQVLFHSPILADSLVNKLHTRTCRNSELCVPCEIDKVALASKIVESTVIPSQLIQKLSTLNEAFTPGLQQDAHDFLVCLRQLYRFPSDTAIFHPFRGELRSRIQCEVNHISDTFEEMLDLSVEIPPLASSLETCLENFFKSEHFDIDNFKCGECFQPVRATKQFEIAKSPMLLCIHLKRFTNLATKITQFIEFPLTLNLSSYSVRQNDQDLSFRLYAIVVHSGSASNDGHYFTFVRSQARDGLPWKLMNDAVVSWSTDAHVLKQHAYMLF